MEVMLFSSPGASIHVSWILSKVGFVLILVNAEPLFKQALLGKFM